MQFFVLTRRKMDQFPAEKWTPDLLEQESQRVRELYTASTVRSIWRRKDMPGAVLVLEAGSEDEARAAANSLPLAKAGMLEIVTLAGLEPYPGFGPR